MQVSAFFGRPFDWYARQSRIVKDLILIGVVGLPVYVGALWFEVLHQFFELTSQHQNHAYEWLIVLFVCLGVAAKFFSVRRVIDLRHEVGLRRKAETEGITWPVTMCLPASIAAGSSRIFSDGPAPSAGGRGLRAPRGGPRQSQADQRRLWPPARRRSSQGGRQAPDANCARGIRGAARRR
jgi:hypothetical protein